MEHPVPPLSRRGIAQERSALRYNHPPMDPKEFVARTEACLSRVAKWLEDFDPDEVEEGDIVVCDECGTEFEVVATEPLELSQVDEEGYEDEDEEVADEEEE